MKEGIHPNYIESSVSCACGVSFTTRATVPEIKVSICSACHPFYTGKERSLDAEGRVDRFKRKYAKNQPATPAS